MTDAYYRQALAQMQDEYSRAVKALEKQVAALSQHNELLVAHNKQQQSREQALTLEVAKLQGLLQQERDYWTRYDRASKEDRDRLTTQLAQAKAETMKQRETSDTLRGDMRALQKRVETAVATSTSFEKRLLVLVQEKHKSVQDVQDQLDHYKRKLHGKRAQNKYLTEALVQLQERSDSSSSKEKPVERSSRRELTLPEEIKSVAATATRTYKSKRLGASRVGTSPTSSSPEISPRSARPAPYRRPPSVATTTPTTSDGNSFNSNGSSSGSIRSLRSMRNVTGRRITSRESSDSDHIDVSPRTSAGRVRAAGNPTGRLERELSGLRKKLDSCMDAAARW